MTGAQPAIRSEFQFLDYWMERLTYAGRPPVESGAQYQYSLNLERSHVELEAPEGVRRVEVRLGVSLTFPGDEKAPFELTATVAGLFEATAGYSPELFDRMCLVNAPALLYAQLRPVSRIVLADGGHTFVLPLVNVAAMLDGAPPVGGRERED